MKLEYIITNAELKAKGLDLNEYALDSAYTQAIINIALDLSITTILSMNDNFSYEEDIIKELDNNNKLVLPFKKLQYQIIYNLVFSENDPINTFVRNIIAFDLKWGKINGFQKTIFGR